jgi:hypothetical protein
MGVEKNYDDGDNNQLRREPEPSKQIAEERSKHVADRAGQIARDLDDADHQIDALIQVIGPRD